MESVEYKYPLKIAQKHVLRITLVGSSPKVWREITVPSTIKLTSLAHVIVLAMGWEESHLSLFKKWKKEYHVYMDGADMYDYPIEDASEYALCDLLGADEEMTFVYDFGDNWRHTVKVVNCVAYEKDEKPSIRLIDGNNFLINGYNQFSMGLFAQSSLPDYIFVQGESVLSPYGIFMCRNECDPLVLSSVMLENRACSADITINEDGYTIDFHMIDHPEPDNEPLCEDRI